MNEPGNGTTANPPSNDSAPTTQRGFSSEEELVYRLKSAIDQKGRYSFRLNDLSAGYAAGQKITVAEARGKIEGKFREHTGMSPQEYLDHHYAQRQQSRGRDNGNGSERGR